MSETNSSSEAVVCPICACIEGNRVVDTREMMFGTREAFRYGACARCGTWWLLDPPADMSPYYPDGYYSFDAPRVRASQRLKHMLGRPLLRMYLSGPGFLQALIEMARGIPPEVQCLSYLRIGPDTSIVDVGTGSGKYLMKLHRLGFSDLTGVDKYVRSSSDLGFGIRVVQGEARDVNRQFDVVTSHHSFEHAANPHEELVALAALVKPGGSVVIRTPNADSTVCREYQGDWFELDPPRHLFVPTPAAMELPAEQAGLQVSLVIWDATSQSIVMSESYRNDVPLHGDEPSIRARTGTTLASMNNFLRESYVSAKRSNSRGEGDRMCVVLRKPAKA